VCNLQILNIIMWQIWPTVTSVYHVLTVVGLTEMTELLDSPVKILLSTIFTTSNNHVGRTTIAQDLLHICPRITITHYPK